jgi:hypothetical protein
MKDERISTVQKMDQRGKSPDRQKKIPVEAKDFRIIASVQTGPAAHLASPTIGTGALSRGKAAEALTSQPHRAPR